MGAGVRTLVCNSFSPLHTPRRSVKMAPGSDLLYQVFLNTEVDEKVVSDLVGSLKSELASSIHINPGVESQTGAQHMASTGTRNNVNAS